MPAIPQIGNAALHGSCTVETGHDNLELPEFSLENLERVKVRNVRDEAGNWHEHTWYTLEVDGFKRTILHTPPSEDVDPNHAALVPFPGFMEMIERGSGASLHKQLAYHNPGSHILSIATKGIGSMGDRIHVWDEDKHGLMAIAQENLRIMDVFTPADHKRIPIGTSMGASIAVRMAALNVQAGKPVRMDGLVLYEPCVVLPDRVLETIVLGFVPSIAADVARQVGRRALSMHEILGITRTFAASLPGPRNRGALEGQAQQLQQGTELDILRTAVANYPTLPIRGGHDSLKEDKMWDELSDEFPTVRRLPPVENYGHSMGMFAKGAANKITKELRNEGLI